MARLTVYPDSDYNSFISYKDANKYFYSRLNSQAWDNAAVDDQFTALLQAYRSLQELDIVIDLSDSDALDAIQQAQCEQAIWELQRDETEWQANAVSLGGLVSVKLNENKPPRHSPKALYILKPYLRCATISRTR